MNKSRILITGGTGFIGSKLCAKLHNMGHDLVILTRQKNLPNQQGFSFINHLEDSEFNFDIVINLAGSPISTRWTKNNLNEIYHSRIDITRQIVAKINTSTNPPRTFLSGSAIGYYGTSESTIFHEESSPTKQNYFSQKLCSDWENEAKKAEEKTRVVRLRTGVVIGKNGGVIKKMLLPFQLGLGGKIASGNQYFSWIHLDDAVDAIIYLAFNDSCKGVFNLVAPNVVNNFEFSKILAKALHRPCIFTIPAISMKLTYKEMAQELLIEGQKVYPKALLNKDFSFKYSNLDEAITQALS